MKTAVNLSTLSLALTATLIGAGLLLSMPSMAADTDGYAADSTNSIVLSNSGECWRTSSWNKDLADAECDPSLIATAVEPTPLVQAEPRRTVQRINLASDAYFAFNKAELRAEGMAKLDEMARNIQGKDEPRLQITGYTDRIGAEAYNMKLSQRRAEAVKDYLIIKGIESDIIETTAMGPKDPVVNCEGKTGNALIQCLGPNRRTVVEFSAFEVIE